MPNERTVSASRTMLADLMSPPDANNNGTVFGGRVLQMVDKAAGVCAMRHAGKPCVTVAMERVEFLVPIQLGAVVSVEAQVNYVGRTSMEIGVEVYAEYVGQGGRKHTNSCLVTMVAVDRRGKPSPVPRLCLETPEERERAFAAEARRKARR
ncbi:MAG: acyl-CoA thioesterase [Elusimicrobia bacterium]|nr:acyl-CoA thioesterase [Elusimicrobiota bacterium]